MLFYLLSETMVTEDQAYLKLLVGSACFLNITQVEQQKMIYQWLMPYSLSGEIHAVSMKTFSIADWQTYCSKYCIKDLDEHNG